MTVRSKRFQALIAGQSTWGTRALDFLPDQWFLPDDTVTLVLRAAVTDTDGNRLDGNRDGVEDGSPTDDFTLVFYTGPGVYPGDADHDGQVNEADILPLGRNWLLTGPERPRAYPGFTVQPALSWSPRAATHADADGSGEIDSADVCPIAEFFARDTGQAKVAITTWLAEARQWPTATVDALLAALDFCAQSAAGSTALRSFLTQSKGQAATPLPKDFALEPNYPNPFNSSTVIPYTLPRRTSVRLDIFDLQGRHVISLVNGEQDADRYVQIWDGRDDAGRTMASGVYFARLRTPQFHQARKMILLK